MTTDIEEMFNAECLSWLQRWVDPNTTEIINIRSEGYDMIGDTYSGFYDTFSLSISYWRDNGEITQRTINVDGTQLESLWDWAIKGEKS